MCKIVPSSLQNIFSEDVSECCVITMHDNSIKGKESASTVYTLLDSLKLENEQYESSNKLKVAALNAESSVKNHLNSFKNIL